MASLPPHSDVVPPPFCLVRSPPVSLDGTGAVPWPSRASSVEAAGELQWLNRRQSKKSTQQLAGGDIFPVLSEQSVKYVPLGNEECHKQSFPGPILQNPSRFLHGGSGFGGSGTLSLFLPGLFQLIPQLRDADWGWQDCTLSWRHEAGVCFAAQPTHCHLLVIQSPPKLHGMPHCTGLCMCRCLPSEPEGHGYFLILFFSSCSLHLGSV